MSFRVTPILDSEPINECIDLTMMSVKVFFFFVVDDTFYSRNNSSIFNFNIFSNRKANLDGTLWRVNN